MKTANYIQQYEEVKKEGASISHSCNVKKRIVHVWTLPESEDEYKVDQDSASDSQPSDAYTSESSDQEFSVPQCKRAKHSEPKKSARKKQGKT